MDTIAWFYGASQDQVFSELAETVQGYGQRIEFVRGLPQDSLFKIYHEFTWSAKIDCTRRIDGKASNRVDMAEQFTHGRHDNVSIMFLMQNFFHMSKYACDMSLNIDYVVFFKNTRDPSMVIHLCQQIGNVKFLKQANHVARSNLFSHLSIDMRSDTLDTLHYQTNVLDETQMVYQPV